ncbi:MAG: ABC transporter permease, partial [Candidatus Heimdallarchaeota archaeon]|nr:ABC transporter permease [Candidatus Heimdallarchaeota archaeon]
MIKHHFKIFLRNLIRRDTVTYINIIGLSVGLACSMLILLWIKNELTYDNFHSNYKEIYRIQLTTFREGVPNDANPITMVPIGPALNENFPEIESFVRLRQIDKLNIQKEDRHYSEKIFLAVDSSFFEIFSFDLIEGNPKTALSDPYKIVLSETVAKKIFANESALGKSVLVNGKDHFVVSGVVEDPPQNSHIKFNGLFSISTLWLDNPCIKWDCNYSFYTYLLLNSGSNAKELEEKFPDFLWEPMNKKNADGGWKEVAHLMPLGDIHFNSTSNYELEPPGNTGMVYLFSAIAIFILAIACINFINLTTAQATKKGKEIGI